MSLDRITRSFEDLSVLSLKGDKRVPKSQILEILMDPDAEYTERFNLVELIEECVNGNMRLFIMHPVLSSSFRILIIYMHTYFISTMWKINE